MVDVVDMADVEVLVKEVEVDEVVDVDLLVLQVEDEVVLVVDVIRGLNCRVITEDTVLLELDVGIITERLVDSDAEVVVIEAVALVLELAVVVVVVCGELEAVELLEEIIGLLELKLSLKLLWDVVVEASVLEVMVEALEYADVDCVGIVDEAVVTLESLVVVMVVVIEPLAVVVVATVRTTLMLGEDPADAEAVVVLVSEAEREIGTVLIVLEVRALEDVARLVDMEAGVIGNYEVEVPLLAIMDWKELGVEVKLEGAVLEGALAEIDMALDATCCVVVDGAGDGVSEGVVVTATVLELPTISELDVENATEAMLVVDVGT